MKRHRLAILLTAILCALCAASCSASKESSTTEPTTRPSSTIDEQVETEPATEIGSTAATDPSGTAKKTKKAKSKTSKNQTATRPNPTATTSPTAPKDIPADTIDGDNINPNLGSIANRVANDIASNQVTSISLSSSELELSVGDTEKVDVTYYPEGAMYKLCSVNVSNKNVIEITDKTNKTISIKGKSAGTCVITVVSANGHKATCSVTVKRNETITDDSKIPHSDLCTAENVNRWAAEITSACSSLGMKQNSSLKGVDITIDTTDNKDQKKSFNEVKAEYVQTVKSQLEALTEGDYKNYVFNCYTESKGGGEYYINVVISKEQE